MSNASKNAQSKAAPAKSGPKAASKAAEPAKSPAKDETVAGNANGTGFTDKEFEALRKGDWDALLRLQDAKRKSGGMGAKLAFLVIGILLGAGGVGGAVASGAVKLGPAVTTTAPSN